MTDRPRRALVTGAARGQGIAVVRRLVDEGYAVVACDVLVDELTAAVADLPEDRVLAHELDVTSEESWAVAVTAARSTYGGLDALVNNAGVLRRSTLVEEDPREFERTWRVNCLGPFLGIRACVPLLRDGNAPAIVNTLSNVALRPFHGHASYTASKWGARGLSLNAAAELAEDGIRVNAVLPGAISTPMLPQENVERIAAWVPLGRPGEADEVASAVVYLLSDGASYMTGSEVLIDGGQMLRTHL